MSLDAIKFDESGAIDSKALATSHPHALEHLTVGGKVTASVVDPAKLLAVVIREVQGLRQRKAPTFDEMDALRVQIAVLTNRLAALEHGFGELEQRPAPAQHAAAHVTHIAPTQELVLHMTADTDLRISSQHRDGVRVATFKLD